MSWLEKPGQVSDLSADAADHAGRAVRPDHVATGPSFEETYPKHEFSELVRLGLALGSWIARMRRRLVVRQSEMPPAPPPGQIAAAE